MPTKSSWSKTSISTCRRNRHRESPPQESLPAHQRPPPCSGDLRDAPSDSAHFSPPVGKVGLARRARRQDELPAQLRFFSDAVLDSHSSSGGGSFDSK